MFERYTEHARRAIFFARYEASQFGSSQIEAVHLLLGLQREAPFLRALVPMATARKWVEERCKPKERTPTSTHMPLSHEAKRVLAYGAEESERLGHKEINCLHLVLGVLREKRSLAAEFLRENGIARDQFIAGLLERPEPSIPGLPATGPLAQRLAAVVAAAKPRLAGISEEVAMVSPQSFEAMGRASSTWLPHIIRYLRAPSPSHASKWGLCRCPPMPPLRTITTCAGTNWWSCGFCCISFW